MASTRSAPQQRDTPSSFQSEHDRIEGLQPHIAIPDHWLLMDNDAKIAACAPIRKKALIGVGELDVSGPQQPRLRLGVRNSRPVDASAARGIATSLYHDLGPRRLVNDMAIHLVARRSWIVDRQWPAQITHENYKNLPRITLTSVGLRAAEAEQLHVVNGQHR
jgi:hypothetical protein